MKIWNRAGQALKQRMSLSMALRLGITLALLGIVLYFVDFNEMADVITSMNPWYIPAVLTFIYLDRALMAYKWGLLLRALKVNVPFSCLFRLYSVAPVVSTILPSTVGGDLFRLYALSRLRVSMRPVIASIILERSIGFIAMLTFAAFSLGLAFYLLGVHWNPLDSEWVWALGFTVVIAAIVAMALLIAFRGQMGRLLQRLARQPLVNKVIKVLAQCFEYRQHRRVLGVVFGWTLLEQMAPIISTFLLVGAFHVDVSFIEMLATIPLIQVASRLPISLDGIGVTEGLYIGLLALVGVSAAEAILISVAGRALFLLATLPWGIHYLLAGNRVPVPDKDRVVAPGKSEHYPRA